MADGGCHMPNADCYLYFGLRPPSSVLLQQSTSPRTLPLPTHPHATPGFSLHASAHRLRTDTGIPTLSASPHPTARGDPLFASSNHYLVFFRLCLGSGLKKLAFAKIKTLLPTDTLFILILISLQYPISHLPRTKGALSKPGRVLGNQLLNLLLGPRGVSFCRLLNNSVDGCFDPIFLRKIDRLGL